MPKQKWMFGNLLLLFCCIGLSHQFLNLHRPFHLLTGGITDVADGLLQIKNNISNAIHTLSPHILGPIVDVLDPEWLTGMNYTLWIMDMEDAIREGNTKQWVKTVSKLLNIDRVIYEVKNSATTKVSCLACKFGINLGRHMMITGKSDREILNFAAQVCSILNVQSTRVCSGVMELIGIDVVEVVRQSDMRPSQICSFLLGDACLDGYDARHDWSIEIPASNSPVPTVQEPPLENAPRLKVLQISDTHYDPYYQEGTNAVCGEPLCCRVTDGSPTTKANAAGRWGDYRKCDAPRHLFENALQHIAETHKDIDYIIWTGDLPPHDIWNQTRQENLDNLRVSAQLMATYFKGIPIFPSVGNHESCPVDSYAPPTAPPRKSMSWLYDELAKEWSRWLPSNTMETIRLGAFYSVLVKPGFRILSVNGNYCSKNNFWLLQNSTDPAGELAWLVRELNMAEMRGEKVHIVGHIPPGLPDCLKVWSRNYYNIVSRYQATITGQFFGHTHYDEFEVFYDTSDFKTPINVGYIAPSITPWENVNPAYRIYYVDGDHQRTTRAIVDHETWKMDLDEANRNGNPVWYKAYTAREAYDMTSLLPKEWDNLISRMNADSDLFENYYGNYYRNSPVRPTCDKTCRKRILCNARSGRSYDRQNLCRDL